MRHEIAQHAASVLEMLYRRTGAAELAYRFSLQPRRVTVSIHRLVTEKLAPGGGLRVVFASDFHAGGVTSRLLLESACQEIESLKADVLLLGGDFVSTRAGDAAGLVDRLGAIQPTYGTYAVLGNHDYYAGAARVGQALAASGITLLRNANLRLPLPRDTVSLCGFDDYNEGRPDASGTFLGAEGFRIVVMHSPEGVHLLKGHEFDLAFCGHTHGGQIALPGGRPIVLPKGRFVRAYNAGEYRLDGAGILIVSRGVGCDFLPIRLFAPSEVILCEISAARSDPVAPG